MSKIGSIFNQFLRIPNHLLPAELQADKIIHPPKYIHPKRKHRQINLTTIDKEATRKVQQEEDMKVMHFSSEDDEGDYQAEKFEDFDQEDMSEDYGGSDE